MLRCLVFIVFFFCIPALGQTGLEGDWVNIDPHTRSMSLIKIHHGSMRPYGSCEDKLCDWGTFHAKAGGDAAEASLIHAKIAESFCQREMQITLQKNGLLEVKVFTHFTDRSGRKDYTSTDYMRRSEIDTKREWPHR